MIDYIQEVSTVRLTEIGVGGDLTPVELAKWRHRLSSAQLPQDEATLIDLLRDLEDLKSTAAAVQAKAAVVFESVRCRAEAAAGLAGSKRGAGVSAEVALARRESPHLGGRLLGLAKALVNELPCTLRALAEGRISEWRATLVARETACLEVPDRLQVDAWLGDHLTQHPSMGDRRLIADIRRKVIELDQNAVVRRRAAAAGTKRVTLQPLPDGMVRLNAILPLTQGMAVYTTLLKAAPTRAGNAADTRQGGGGRGALMADELVERVTGREAQAPCDVELMVVMTDRALLGAGDEPAHVDGYGPISAGWVRDLIATTAETEQQVAVRRLFQSPRRMVQLETSRRLMSPALRKLIAIRDQYCRTPWCGAPIRHADHVQEYARQGPTSLLNGQGLCESCNYTKQQPGWRSSPHQDPRRGHIVTLTTPTGHLYESTHPSRPGEATESPLGVTAR